MGSRRGRFARIGSGLGLAVLVGSSLLPACSRTANVSEVFTALDSIGDRRRTVFTTDTKAIHCVAELGISRPGVTLEFVVRQLQRYDFDDNVFKDSNRIIGQAEFTPAKNQAGAFKTDLTIDKLGPDGRRANDGPYPPGRYQCEVSIDGERDGEAVFNIEFPPCPTAQIVPGAICFGFYQDQRQCPAFGLTGDKNTVCECTKKGWQCP